MDFKKIITQVKGTTEDLKEKPRPKSKRLVTLWTKTTTALTSGITYYGAIYAFDSLDIHGGSTVNYVQSYLAP